MKRLVNYLKSLCSWDSSNSNPKLKKYDWAIAILVLFLVGYAALSMYMVRQEIIQNKSAIVKIEVTELIDPTSVKIV